MTARPALQRLLAPRSIAIVGASPNPNRGTRLHANLQRYAYPGRLYAVNPKYTEVRGTPCFPSLAEVPEVVDCAVIVLPAEPALTVAVQCAGLGVGAAVILASGFAEAGPPGLERQRRLQAVAASADVAICGPNCVGLLNVGEHTAPFSPPLPIFPPLGGTAVVSQSGGLLLELLTPLLERGVGLSHVVSTGNEAATHLEDFVAYLVEQPAVRTVAALVESFKRPRALPGVLERARSLGKTVVVLKVGRSEHGRRAAASHTGSLAQSDQVVDAVLRRGGAIRVQTTEHLIEALVLLDRGRDLPREGRLALVCSSGGRCTLLGDLAADVGLPLAEFAPETRARLRSLLPDFAGSNNPFDPTGVIFDRDDVYAPTLQAIADDPGVGVVGVYQVTRSLNVAGAAEHRTHRSVALAREIAAAARSVETPIVTFTSSTGGTVDPEVTAVLDAAGVPLLHGLENALRAIGSAMQLAADRRVAAESDIPSSRPTPDHDGVLRPFLERLRRNGALAEHEAKQLLALYDIPVARGALACSAEEAVRVADSLGYPVALKAVSPRITHKSDAGLLRLGVADGASVALTFGNLLQAAGSFLGGAPPDGILVEQMAAPGLEVIVGARVTEFGPVVLVGAGGVLAEMLQDSALAVAPVGERAARDLVHQTRLSRLLGGYRGSAPLDEPALVRVVARVSQLIADLQDTVAEIDVNPLILTPSGALAVDALITAPV